jgi:PAS domain-containing protein
MTATAPRSTSAKTPLRILIVEDSPDDAELILRELRRGGYEPQFRVVDSAETAAEALKTHRWDIVVSDFNLPRKDFSQVLKLAQSVDPDRPFIVVSGAIGEETAVSLMRDGAADLILKSNLSRFVPAVQRELTAAEQQYERRAGEQRFRDIVSISGDWIWETDSAYRFTFFSSRHDESEWSAPFRSLGRTCWEAIGASVESDEHWRNHKANLDARRPFRNFLISFASPSRERYHVSISGVPVFDRERAFSGYRGTASNQTLVVEAFWRAEQAEALLRDAVESLSEGLVILDSNDRIVMVNEAFRSLYHAVADLAAPGTALKDFMQAAVERRIFPDAVGREEQWLSKNVPDGRELSDKRVWQLADGRWVLVTERRMRNGGLAGLNMDVTALKIAAASHAGAPTNLSDDGTALSRE